MNDNPYQAPEARLTPSADSPDEAESTRRAHLKHEASLRSFGILYYLGGAISVVLGLVFVLTPVIDVDTYTQMGVVAIVIGVFFIVLGALSLAAGRGLRVLQKWAKVPAGITAVIGLLSFPIGTIINGYVLYLVFSDKGSTILSDEYKQVIALTPHIRYKTPLLVWLLLGLIVLAVIAAVVVGL